MAIGVNQLARISLNSADPPLLAQFYIDALGFTVLKDRSGSAQVLRLALGETRLDLVRARGTPYPAEVPGWSPLFQHCAIVTSNMAQAMAHLQRFSGWTAISQKGPEQLPKSSGGVRAFKFRDPEGHPLEFLEFPVQPQRPKLFLDIDHSAISVANTERSIAFYTALGLHVGATSLNVGVEQQRLDNVQDPQVEVTALQFATDTKPHVELLCYRGSYDRSGAWAQPDHIAATRIVCTVQARESIVAICQRFPEHVIRRDAATALLHDPDGHLIEIEVAA